jgi:hypothetical protein
MLIMLIFALLWAVWCVADAAIDSLHGLPRSNEDMVFY